MKIIYILFIVMMAVSFLIILCIDNRHIFDYRGGDNLALRVQERSDMEPIGENNWLSGGDNFALRVQKSSELNPLGKGQEMFGGDEKLPRDCPCEGRGCGCCQDVKGGKPCKCPKDCPCRTNPNVEDGVKQCIKINGQINDSIRGGGCDSGCDCSYRGGKGCGCGPPEELRGGDSIPVDNQRGLGCGCGHGTSLNMFGVANDTISPAQKAGIIGSVGTNNPEKPPLI